MIRLFFLMFVFLSFPVFVAQVDVTQDAKVSLDFTQDRFKENVHTLIRSKNLQELELLMPQRALNEENLVKNLSVLFGTSTTLQKIRFSIPKGIAVCGYNFGSEASPLFESLAKNRIVRSLDVDPNFAFVSTENVVALTTLISQNFLEELSVGLGNDWRSYDFFALGLMLSQGSALTKLSLKIIVINEDDAASLVSAIKENKSLTYVRLKYDGGHTEGEVTPIRTIFKEADKG